MTTPQSGREAFEALVEKWRDAARGIRPSGTWNGNDLADRYEWCAEELEAALAQQGREVGEVDTLRTARSAAYRNRFDHAYLPQTSEAAAIWAPHEWVIEAMEAHARNCHAARLAAAPKQQAVDVDAIRADAELILSELDAVTAYTDDASDHIGCAEIAATRIIAALSGKTEVE